MENTTLLLPREPGVISPDADPKPLPRNGEQPSPSFTRWALGGWLALGLFLLFAVPLFVCMPLCIDTVDHDLCAWNLLRGGVPYRDAFETNLPGMDWLHAGFRWMFGWRSETLRLIDLGLFSVLALLALKYLKRIHCPSGVRAWTAFILFVYYLGLNELCQVQRDVWMFVPTLAALHLRLSQTERAAAGKNGSSLFVWGVLEGLCWGMAIWIKPFVLSVVIACWLVHVLQARQAGAAWGKLLSDTLGLFGGGLLAGSLGLIWLYHSGGWPYFWDIMLHWNSEYQQGHSWASRIFFLKLWLVQSLPWCLVLPIALVAALFALRGLFGRHRSRTAPSAALWGRHLFAAFFLGWMFQSILLQVPHQYVLSTLVLCAFLWLAAVPVFWRPSRATAAVLILATLFVLSRHPVFQPARLACWASCFQEGSSNALRDRLKIRMEITSTDWEDLNKVRQYLARQNLRDRDLVCFHDGTQSLYLQLQTAPGARFFEWFIILTLFPGHHEAIRQELDSSPHRYVVSDLIALGFAREKIALVPEGKPVAAPTPIDQYYPWYEPVVFRAGRYQVHARTQPVRPIWFGTNNASQHQ